MRIGLFYPGPWVAGGTERHLLGMASVMGRTGVVDVLTFWPASWPDLSRKLSIELRGIRFRAVAETAADALMGHTGDYELWINGSPWDVVPSRCPQSILVVVYPPVLTLSPARRLRRVAGLGMRHLLGRPQVESLVSKLAPRLVRRLKTLSSISAQDAVGTYPLLLANSAFTQRTIQRQWRRESVVLYPPIDTASLHPHEKRNSILSVGRFGHGGNNKKHLVLIKVFRNLVDHGLRGWALHLAGSTHDNPRDRAYLAEIRRAAAGCPIVLHSDCSREELARLYGESAIYWHAAGYGEDEERNPLAVEHFGITTVEAMAAGCVPIVCGRGGQPEIVQHGLTGFLWETMGELEEYTLYAIKDAAAAQQLRERAIIRSRDFGMERFEVRFRGILDALSGQGSASRGHH